jgi:hypothetical protein
MGLKAAATSKLRFNPQIRDGVAVLESALLFGLTPEHFVIPVGVERWVDINEVNAGVR